MTTPIQNFQLQNSSENNDLTIGEEQFLPATLPNGKLCEIIVAYRYLGIMEKQAVMSMEELAIRREKGDLFDYETTISDLMKDLPKISIDLNKVFQSFKLPKI